MRIVGMIKNGLPMQAARTVKTAAIQQITTKNAAHMFLSCPLIQTSDIVSVTTWQANTTESWASAMHNGASTVNIDMLTMTKAVKAFERTIELKFSLCHLVQLISSHYKLRCRDTYRC